MGQIRRSSLASQSGDTLYIHRSIKLYTTNPPHVRKKVITC